MSYSLNSLKGGFIGDYIEEYYKVDFTVTLRLPSTFIKYQGRNTIIIPSTIIESPKTLFLVGGKGATISIRF